MLICSKMEAEIEQLKKVNHRLTDEADIAEDQANHVKVSY